MIKLILVLLVPALTLAQRPITPGATLAPVETDGWHVVDFSADGVDLLSVDWSNGSITVIGGAADVVNVKVRGVRDGRNVASAEWLSLCVFERRDDAVVAVYKPPAEASKLSLELMITIPRRLAVALEVGNGNVAVENAASLEVKSGNGDVRTVGVPGRVRINAGNGRLDLRIPEGYRERLAVKNGNGDIAIHAGRGLSGDLVAETGNGNITVTLVEVPRELNVSALTGMGDALTNIDGVTRQASLAGGGLSKAGDGPVISLTTGRGNVEVSTR